MIKYIIILFLSVYICVAPAYAQRYKEIKPKSVYTESTASSGSNDFKKGVDFINNERYDEAIGLFKKIVQAEENNALAHTNLGTAFFNKGAMSTAQLHFDKALEINRALHWAWFGKGKVAMNTHKEKKAVSYFKIAHEIKKDEEKYIFMYGVALKEFGEHQKAIEVLKQLIQSEEYKADAYLEIGNVYALMFEFEKSMQYYDKAEEEGASADVIDLNRAKVSSAKEDNSVDGLDAYINNHPNDSRGLVIRGNYYLKNEQYEKAVQDFSTAIQVDENEVNAYNGRAAAYIKLSEYEKAIQDCNQAIDLDPNFAMVFYNRGIAKEMTRDVNGACYDWEQAFFLGIDKAEEYLNSPTCNEE